MLVGLQDLQPVRVGILGSVVAVDFIGLDGLRGFAECPFRVGGLRGLCAWNLLESGILQNLLLHGLHEVQVGELEQLNRLAQLRRDDQLLAEFEILF